MPPAPSCRGTGPTSRARQAVSSAEFLSNRPSTFGHRAQLAEGDLPGEAHQTTVRSNDEPLGRNHLEAPANPVSYERRRFDLVRLHIDDADSHLERDVELFEQLEIILAPARELHRHGLNLCIEDGGEEELVTAFERWLY